ncbi:NnrS family protein [Neiella marina]|uniref:NnrS family protein n=1 Tax=Neiella holothuriorum TaxID=2870530 RepID=A0ABS7EDV0_9GAMM|nr:NnrS family protein [Neiella holothuriorum]MBW8190001.1 NnrS family protein [Neiella holothuriorum]
MQITDRAIEDKTMPLFRLAFRPLFLFGTLYAGFIMLRWILTLSGSWQWTHPVALFGWHGHELQFGFAMAIIIGFLCTATQNWTGIPGLRSWPLVALTSCWIAGRLVANIWPESSLLFLFDSLFIVGGALAVGRQLILSGNRRNLVFLPILAVFLALHLAQVWAFQSAPQYSRPLGFAGIWWVAVIISMLAARVVPFFIERRLNDKLPRDSAWWIAGAQFSLVALAVASLFQSPEFVLQTAAGIGLIFQLPRLLRWYRAGIWSEPLLWSLYLSFACLPLALWLQLFTGQQHISVVMHVLGVGLMGGMIIAMMARVSLGHTGRPLKAHPMAVIAMAAMLVAALSRTVIPLFGSGWLQISYHLAATAWLLSIFCFLWVYVPILVRARVDGNPG